MQTKTESGPKENGVKLIKNLAVIGALVILSAIPTCATNLLVQDRMSYEKEAIKSVIEGWASPQTFGESNVNVPTTVKDAYDENEKKYTFRDGELTYRPVFRDIDISTKHEYRKRGIFEIPIITTETTMANTFNVETMRKEMKHFQHELSKTKPIMLTIDHSSPSTITSFEVDIDGVKAPAKRSSTGLEIQLDPSFLQKEHIIVRTRFISKTYSELSLKLPSGENVVKMTSTWPHPSFVGQLPQEHTTNRNGFTATWNLFEPSPDQILTVRFFEPINTYSLNFRALKYAVLVIVLSLTLFFLFEILFQLRLHGMHYLLLSLPLSVFFVLLLALSEHVSFLWAYTLASGATIGLMTTYLIGIGAAKKLAFTFTLYLGMVYGVIFTLLNSEDYALLLGSISLFFALAVFMLLTRKVNWRKLKIENAEPATVS